MIKVIKIGYQRNLAAAFSEAQRKHFAEDGGKSKEEIEKIKGAEKQVQIVAAGVKVLD